MFQAPPGFPPERLLLFGPPGSGKSKAAHSIALRLIQSGSRNRMHVLDTDFSWARFLASEGDPGNILVTVADEWEPYVKGIQKVLTQGQQGDWVVIDLIGVAWEMAQNAYIERAYGKDPIDFLLDARKTMKKNAGMGAALSGMGDWPFIKRMYRSAMNDLVAQSRFHLIGVTTQEKVWDSDAPDTFATYNQLGGKPGGEKHLDYGFHSVLQCGHNRAQGHWWLTTAKDRGRTILARTPMADAASGGFSRSYLEDVAGWSDPMVGAPLVAPTTTLVASPPQGNGSTAGETPAEKLARIKAMRTRG